MVVTVSDSTGAGATRRARSVGAADLPFLALAVLAVALVVYLGRSSTFWNDEWRFITFDGSGLDYLRPFNEHWNTLPLLLYRATYAVVGLRTYLPYLLEVVVLHVVAVAAAYVLVRARLGAATATLLALPLLLLQQRQTLLKQPTALQQPPGIPQHLKRQQRQLRWHAL